jgi:MFS family permease
MGLFELIAYGGSSLGSAVGGYMAFAQGLRLPFFGIVILSVIGAIVGSATIVETRNITKTEIKSTSTDVGGSYSSALKRSIPLYIAGFSSKIMDSLTISILPLYLAVLKMNIVEITAITSAFTFSWALSQPLTGYISDRLGRKKIVVIGLASTAVCVLPYTLIDNFVLMLVLALALGFSAALFYTPLLAMVGDISPPSLRGTLIGSYRFFRDMGYFAGPILLGIVADTYGILYAFYVTSLILFITTAVVYAASRETLIANA